MPTSVSFAGNTYNIPNAGELDWSSLSSYLIAVANKAGLNTIQIQAIRVATTSPVTVSASTDWAVETNLSSAGAVTVNLPAGVTGQTFFIVDGKGDAATHNITVTPNGVQTINGASTYVINRSNGGVYVAFDGTQWLVLAATGATTGTVTSVALTVPGGGVLSVSGSPVTSSGTLAVAAAGSQGGIPYFATGSTISSTTALTLDGIVLGGGTGSAPTSTAAGTNGQLLVGNTSAAPSWLSAGTSSQVLAGGSTPTWGTLPTAALPSYVSGTTSNLNSGSTGTTSITPTTLVASSVWLFVAAAGNNSGQESSLALITRDSSASLYTINTITTSGSNPPTFGIGGSNDVVITNHSGGFRDYNWSFTRLY